MSKGQTSNDPLNTTQKPNHCAIWTHPQNQGELGCSGRGEQFLLLRHLYVLSFFWVSFSIISSSRRFFIKGILLKTRFDLAMLIPLYLYSHENELCRHISSETETVFFHQYFRCSDVCIWFILCNKGILIFNSPKFPCGYF